MTLLDFLKQENEFNLMNAIFNDQIITPAGVVKVLDLINRSSLSDDEVLSLDLSDLISASYSLKLADFSDASYLLSFPTPFDNETKKYSNQPIAALIVFARKYKFDLKEMLLDLTNDEPHSCDKNNTKIEKIR